MSGRHRLDASFREDPPAGEWWHSKGSGNEGVRPRCRQAFPRRWRISQERSSRDRMAAHRAEAEQDFSRGCPQGFRIQARCRDGGSTHRGNAQRAQDAKGTHPQGWSAVAYLAGDSGQEVQDRKAGSRWPSESRMAGRSRSNQRASRQVDVSSPRVGGAAQRRAGLILRGRFRRHLRNRLHELGSFRTEARRAH